LLVELLVKDDKTNKKTSFHVSAYCTAAEVDADLLSAKKKFVKQIARNCNAICKNFFLTMPNLSLTITAGTCRKATGNIGSGTGA
jgi:hypothetical protein